MTQVTNKRTRGGPHGLWLALHKWIGLVLGIWLACQAATGTLLVFWYEIEAAVASDLYRTGTPIAEVDYDGMVATVAAAYPDRRIAYLQRDMLAADEAFRFVLVKSGQLPSPFEDWEVFVDSSSGRLLGSRPWLTVMRTLWLLHNGLLIEPYEDVLAALGVALLISICTGIVLWWPRNGRFKPALRYKLHGPTPAIIRALHTVSGAYVGIMLLLMAITGLVIVLPGPARLVIEQFAEVRPLKPFTTDIRNEESSSLDARQIQNVKLNDLSASVEQSYPGSTVNLLLFPHIEGTGTFTFRLLPEGKSVALATTQVYLDPGTGKILDTFDPSSQPSANTYLGLWNLYIHAGQRAGLFGRLVVLFTGIILLSLFGTGLYIWWKKRQSRSRRARQATVPSAYAACPDGEASGSRPATESGPKRYSDRDTC